MANPYMDTVRTGDYGYGYDDREYNTSQAHYTPDPVPSSYKPNEVPPPVATQEQKGIEGERQKTTIQKYVERYITDAKYELFISKAFYFFFFAAFGSLFPFIGIYFKQLGMNPAEAGMLIGFRPFVELIGGPFWGNMADKYKKWRTILLFSLVCWIVFTVSLAYVQPNAHLCLVHNRTRIFVMPPYTIQNLAQAEMVEKNQIAAVEEEAARRGKRSVKNNDSQIEFYRPIHNYLPHDDIPIRLRSKRSGNLQDTIRSNDPGGFDSRHSDEFDNDDANIKSGNLENKMKRQNSEDNIVVNDIKRRIRRQDDSSGRHPSISYIPDNLYRFSKLPYPDTCGLSPLPVDKKEIENLDESAGVQLVSPPLSAVVYRVRDITGVFLILLILQILGEFLSTPAISMADTATLGYVDNDVEKYGRQRMYGSLGWAVAMFFVGIALDYSNIFPHHPCGTEHIVDRNYMTCYAAFAIFMTMALLVATQFRFKEVDSEFQAIQLAQLKNKMLEKMQKTLNREDGGLKPAENLEGKNQITLEVENQPVIISDAEGAPATKPSPFIPRGQPGQAGTLLQWMTVLRCYSPVQYSSMLFVLWYMGFGVGLVFGFLFWHLQDLKGTPILFGISSVINHISEIAAFFYVKEVVARYGYMKVIYAGLTANFIRFLYLSMISYPWLIIPFEMLQGVTHAGVWAAGCSYLTQFIPVANRPTAQMILQSIHHALGRGCGVIIGGALINNFGSYPVFLGYGITCIFVTAGFVALQVLYIKYLPSTTTGPGKSGMSMESTYLAPHGVPGGIPHSLSSSRLEKAADQNFQGGKSSNGHLDTGASRAGDQYGVYNGPPQSGRDDYGYGYSLDPITDDQIFSNNSNKRYKHQNNFTRKPENNNKNGELKNEMIHEKLIIAAPSRPPVKVKLAQPPARVGSGEEYAEHDWLY